MQIKIIIIRGNSGSGKTTVAKTLQKRIGRNTFLISQDVVRRDMLHVKDGVNTEALGLLMNLIDYGEQHCQVMILEGILHSGWYHELFEKIKEDFGQQIYAYYYDIPFEETLKRHQTKPNCHEFGEEKMRKWWNEKDYIGIIPEQNIMKDESVEQVAQRILKDAGI